MFMAKCDVWKKITFLHKQASEQKKNFFLRIVILWGKESSEKKST